MRGDPIGLGTCAMGREESQPCPAQLFSRQGRLYGVRCPIPAPNAHLQLADNSQSRLRLSARRPSSHQPPPTNRSAKQDPSTKPRGSQNSDAELCDRRLEDIKIIEWTKVPISNELGARLISFYLTVDHPILGLFDADLFVADLVALKTEFCCPLLLSAVLCFACVCRQDPLSPIVVSTSFLKRPFQD